MRSPTPGYTPAFVARSVDDPRLVAQRRAQLKRLAVAGFAMMQVMMFSLPLYVAHSDGMNAFYQTLFRWSALIFSTPVVFYCAAPFFRNAAASVAHTVRGASAGAASGLAMDVPVALAIAVAYAASVIATVSGRRRCVLRLGDDVHVPAARRAFPRTTDPPSPRAVRQLAGAAAGMGIARDRRPASNGSRSSTIRAGDRIVVASGSRIPIDGAIVDGATQVDESALTGESRPVSTKRPDSARLPAR